MIGIPRHDLSFYEEVVENDNEAFAIAKDLIENLFFDMSKLCTKYCNDAILWDPPYTYSERRLDCVLLPVLSKLCNSLVFTEYPTRRQSTKRYDPDKCKEGRIDYLCIYKGYTIVIELKHSFDCFLTPDTRDDKVTSRWDDMIKQLQSLKKEVKHYQERTKCVILVGLHLITSYSDKAPTPSLVSSFRDGIQKTFLRFRDDLGKKHPSHKPDLMICWNIPNRIVLHDERTYPGLWALAKIYDPITHKGSKQQ